MSIRDVQHQPRAHRVIQRALAGHRMPHAYLFTGPDGVGREMMAVRLAKVLLCTSRVQVTPSNSADMPLVACPPVSDQTALADKPPVAQALPSESRVPSPESRLTDACDQCEDCRLVLAGTHPDLFVIHRQLNREHPDSQVRKQKALNLGVDVIRHFVIDRVNRRPMRGRAKVFVIREAERLSDTAQNSLLKTLEEPPPDTFIVLITSALDRMLPTTKSRCQPVVFQPLPASFVAEKLRSMRPDAAAEELNFAALQSGGSLGTALRLVDDGLFAMKKTWGEYLMTLARPPRGFAPHLLAQPFIADAKTIGKLAAERDPDMSDTDATRVGIQALLGTIAGFYQDAQRHATGAAVVATNDDQPQVIDAIAAAHSPRQIATALQQISQADAAINRNAALELTVEAMFIGLGAVAQGRSIRMAIG